MASLLKTNYYRVNGICNGTITPGRKVVQSIADAFPEVNSEWLLTGVGPMLKSENSGEVEALRSLVSTLQAQVNEQSEVIKTLINTNQALSQLLNNE